MLSIYVCKLAFFSRCLLQGRFKFSSGNAENHRHRWKTEKLAAVLALILIEFLVNIVSSSRKYTDMHCILILRF